MKKVNASTIIIVLLILLNSLTIGFMWMNHGSRHMPPPPMGPPMMQRPPQGGPGGPANFIIQELSFDDKQQAEFEKLKSDHHEKISSIRDSLHILKEQLFNGIPSGNMAEAEKTASAIANLQKKLELVTYEHFWSVRQLCNEQQKTKFDKIVGRVLEMLAPPAPPMPPGGPEGPPPPPGHERN